MANRFFNPNEQFCDAAGLPYVGGTLAFFASGTSIPLNTFSDSGLSIANNNPVVLDSAGRANSVFLQNLAYKVVLSQANGDGTFSQIWTEDPVYASDYSTRAKLTSGSGSPNGSVAGTAGSTGIGADTYWDIVNNILYVCTQTGTSSTAVWTAVNATSAAAVVPAPQGYLTPTSGTPVITADVIANTSLVYTPYVGNTVPVYSGTTFIPTVFSELTLTLTSSQAASTIYDVFVFNNVGVLTLVTGPAWSNSTAGSCARGTGAGTTQLSRLSGIWVNTVSMTGRNSSNTFSIPANQATYLGSIFIDSVAGQITLHRSYGQSRKWAIWNAYNRVPLYLKAGDGTASWNTTSSIGPRASNNNSANSLTVFMGLPEEIFSSDFKQKIRFSSSVGATAMSAQIGIGINSTSAYTGATIIEEFNLAGTGTVANLGSGAYVSVPALGLTTVSAVESASANTQTVTFFGTEAAMVLAASYRG